MQQPHYYNPDGGIAIGSDECQGETDEDNFVQKHARKEGRPLDATEEKHVKMMESLASSYKTWIYPPRSLDQAFYEWLSDKEEYRNGDQVLSRYLARYWFQSRKRSSEQTAFPDDPAEYRVKSENTPPDHSEIPHSVSEITLQDPAAWANVALESGLTPRQLESQDTRPVSQRSERPLPPSPTPGVPSPTISGRSLPVLDLLQKVKAMAGWNQEKEELELPQPKTARQQILVVPQFWIWRIDDIVLTSFPERWDWSNTLDLPGLIADKLGRLEAEAEIDRVMEAIVSTSLEFEPLLPSLDETSHLHAFASEIADLSIKVTNCYRDYRDSLGKAADDFATATQKATPHLLMADDILNELAIIRRVQQDRDRVGLLSVGNGRRRRCRCQQSGRREDSPEGRSFYQHHSSTSNGEESLPLEEYGHNHLSAAVERLEEDARRIATLLDLRQRQASTEEVIQSRRQSLLLFIFTGATVIFVSLAFLCNQLAATDRSSVTGTALLGI
ncbi:unnamed protein product [Clonostachys chloroleuca]|uniref:Uncharacterized protein n=1 Tax=Clonostachys chloroleuca TaxID=1926264 RepID=A0AA35M6M8_9HYPO|nr:unnamed protein product [Clonostachys chloroleuca]